MGGLAARHRLDDLAASKLTRLLEALSAEADPPTTVVEPARAVDVHLADSLSGLAVEPLRRARRLADIGAGAGFPGLALAAALPETQADLVESSRRKCEVVERLRAAAEIANARPITARAEDWARDAGAGAYEAVTVRALAPLPVLCEYAAPLLVLGGALVCWKGAREPAEEEAGRTAAAQTGLEPAEVVEAQPFRDAHSRHLHVFVKAAPTPPRFPRRAGMAAKRPLGR